MAVPAKRIVLLSMTGTGVVVMVEKATKGRFPGTRTLLGLAVLYVILGFISDFAPGVAGPLAVLVFLAVLLTNGGTALEGTSRALNAEQRIPNRPHSGRNLDPSLARHRRDERRA
jgi:hypothetical protein